MWTCGLHDPLDSGPIGVGMQFWWQQWMRVMQTFAQYTNFLGIQGPGTNVADHRQGPNSNRYVTSDHPDIDNKNIETCEHRMSKQLETSIPTVDDSAHTISLLS